MRICDLLRCTDYSERKRTVGLVSCLAGHQDWHTVVRSLGIAWPRSPVLRAIYPKSVELLSSRSMDVDPIRSGKIRVHNP